jgi:serine/threonine protein kinase/tetratricopeptide (TPR) repeat protein
MTSDAKPTPAVHHAPVALRLDRSVQGPGGNVELLRSLQQDAPEVAERLADALAHLPEPGDHLLGFQLLAELGRGTFGRVYLARQPDLADRFVALKVSTDLLGESHVLAQLQHTNIVPIYSVHPADPYQAVCMPFWGSTTLADILHEWRGREGLARSGKVLVATLSRRRERTRLLLESVSAHSVPSDMDSTRAFGGGFPRSSRASAQRPALAEQIGAPPERPAAILDMLGGLGHVEVVLWIASRLASGLAHAHVRGIYHRDLKPANILLTDEGQPMLLDFGVAEDVKACCLTAGAPVGGTLPYMAPEHLEALVGHDRRVDGRSDIYSLGLILYELLTGRHPFAVPAGPWKAEVQRMLAERWLSPPRLRPWNRAISPAVEAIVRHCLEPDPGRRYQSAQELEEDLERQRAGLPLRHVREPSLRERAGKWLRRHPGVLSRSSLVALTVALVLSVGGLLAFRGYRFSQLEAREAFDQFRAEARLAQFQLTSHAIEAEQAEEGIGHGQRALGLFGVSDGPDWLNRRLVRHLPARDQDQVRAEAGDLLLLLARANLVRAGRADRTRKVEQLYEALRLNEAAEGCYDPEQAPQTLWSQRAEVLTLLGQSERGGEARKQAEQVPLRAARDFYLAGTEQMGEGQYTRALPLLQEAAERDPLSFWARLALGNCQAGLGQFSEARASYTTAIALQPDFPGGYFNRALVYIQQHDYRRALADLDRVLEMQPGSIDAHINRAVALEGAGRPREAVRDLSTALEFGATATRIYFMRSHARELAGDKVGAQADLAEGLRRTPADEKSWLARGVARLSSDLPGALADFEKASDLEPRSLMALQNRAHVLSRLKRNAEAVGVLNRVVQLYPDYVPGWAGRGVLLARLGKWSEARRDAARALVLDRSPSNVYQIAGIYALCSQDDVEDRDEALQLLASALRRGFGHAYLDSDQELDPLRGLPEFRKLVEAARTLEAKKAATR